MSRVNRTISSSESDIRTTSENREEIHQIKEIECEKRVEQTKPKVRSKPMTKSKMYYWINKPVNKKDKVVEWLRNNSEYHAVNEPDSDVKREIIRPDGTVHRFSERDWLEEILSKTRRIPIEQPKPIRIMPGVNDEMIQTEYEMIPKRSENVTLEMRLRNERNEMNEQPVWKEYEEIKYEIVPPKPNDLSYLKDQKKK